MGTKLGLVGLPNVGKSTLFNALTAAHAAVAPYPFTTIDPHVGVTSVADTRLDALAARLVPARVVPTTITFVDIAGLMKGAHKGEGLGNQFLSHLAGIDAILHVVRCFDDGHVAHPLGEVDPLRDVEVIMTELMLKDLEVIDRRKAQVQKLAKGGEKAAQHLLERLERWHAALAAGTPLRSLALAPEEHPSASGLDLLSATPMLYVANIAEPMRGTTVPAVERLRDLAEREGSKVLVLCAKLEAEVAELEPADRPALMQELGLEVSALPQVIQQGAALLNLLTFFTTASNILQAWTVARGTTAPRAAGIIHTDFERGFIRAEVIQVEALLRCGSEAIARAQGLLRIEGKEYVVQDGDVIHFRVAPG